MLDKIKTGLLFLSVLTLTACQLDVVNEGGGRVTSETNKIDCGEVCSANYSGSNVIEVLTATADAGYEFTGWSDACAGTDLCAVILGSKTGDKLVTATFERKASAISELVSGSFHACHLRNSAVECWGSNYLSVSEVPENLVNPSALAAGSYHTCAIDDNGVQCWGSNQEGQSTPPEGLENPREIAAGARATCVLDDYGVTCFGDNGSLDITHVPFTNPRGISAGTSNYCAIDDSGVVCWGHRFGGIVEVPDKLVNPREVSVSSQHACALDDNGVTCWGSDAQGQLAVPTGLKNPTNLVTGNVSSCLLDDGEVICWGSNNSFLSTVPDTLVNPTKIAMGTFYNCASDDNGITCWGRDPREHVASYEGNYVAAPDFVSYPWPVASGYRFACILKNGEVECEGTNNNFGQLNPPGSVDKPQVIAAGENHVCAINNLGSANLEGERSEMICWGGDTYGESSVPNDLVNPFALSTSWRSTCALAESGVHCWGDNTYGILDVPSNLVNPVEIASSSEKRVCVRDDSGTVCWGASVTE